MMLAVGLSYMVFITLRYVPSVPMFWRVFIINECWILSKAFSASIEMIIWFFLLQFTHAVYHTGWYSDNEMSLHPWDKSHLMMVYNLVGFYLLVFCWGLLYLCSSVILACNFLLFFVFGIFVWFWYQGDGGPLSESGRIPSSAIFWNSFRGIIVNFSLNVW